MRGIIVLGLGVIGGYGIRRAFEAKEHSVPLSLAFKDPFSPIAKLMPKPAAAANGTAPTPLTPMP